MIELVKSKQHKIYELQRQLNPLIDCIMNEPDGLPMGYQSMQEVIDKAAELNQKLHNVQQSGSYEVDPIALLIQQEQDQRRV